MKAILITGGAGFIGSHLCEYTLKKYKKDYDIICIDDLSGSERNNIIDLEKEGLIFKKLDLRNQKKVKEYFNQHISKYKEIYSIYLASAAHEGRSFFTPNENMSRNDQAYRVFLTECIKYNLKKIVVFSSMSRYGNGFEGKYEPPFSEDMPVYPIDPYAASKVLMEYLTNIQSKVFGFDYTILVPHNVFGERQCYYDPYRNVLAIWMHLLRKGKRPIIYGDGTQTRAFSYILNSRDQMVDCLFNKDTNSEVINIGGIVEYTINEALKTLIRISGSKVKPKHIKERPREAKHSYCTFEKSVDLLNYKEEYSFEMGLEKMWYWFIEQPDKDFIYMDELEITNDKTPRTWTKKLF